MGNWKELGMDAANTATGGLLGAGMGLINNAMQYRQQEKLQALQMRGQKEMTDYNMNKQYEMWKMTGPVGYGKELDIAGMNRALMYGMSGAGGQTAGVNPGNVGSANADSKGMDIAGAMQLQLLQAQKENIQAQTKKLNSEVPVNEANANATKLATAFEQWLRTHDVGSNEVETGSSVAGGQRISENRRAENEAAIAGMNAALQTWMQESTPEGENAARWQDTVTGRQKIAEMLAAEMQKKLAEKSINVSDAQIAKMAADIVQRAQEIAISEGHLDVQKAQQAFDNDWGTIIGKGAVDAIGGLIKIAPFANIFKKAEKRAPAVEGFARKKPY